MDNRHARARLRTMVDSVYRNVRAKQQQRHVWASRATIRLPHSLKAHHPFSSLTVKDLKALAHLSTCCRSLSLAIACPCSKGHLCLPVEKTTRED